MKSTHQILMTSIALLAMHVPSLAADKTKPAAQPLPPAADARPSRCKVFQWTPGDIIPVEAQLFKQTHITLPEDAIDVIWGTEILWEQNFVKGNVFITPRTKEAEGEETTATAVGVSGNSYEFAIVRVPKMTSHCVTVKVTGSLVHKENWANTAKDTAQQAQIQQLQQQLIKANAEKAQLATETQRQMKAAVKSYRSALFSNYDWTEGSGWFATSGIEAVQDDGRFTYIRLKTDNRGILSVTAEIDGQPEALEKTYDAAKREYKIPGVYPKFLLRAGDSEMTITRRGQ
jgi:type IV secretory pathway VirB9-like protein